MANDWLGNNVDKAQDKDRDNVRKNINKRSKGQDSAERQEIRRTTERTVPVNGGFANTEVLDIIVIELNKGQS
jgi:hypothetical protein